MKNIFIHESAEVSPEAKIGAGTKIWNQAQVRENARIGQNCVISKNVYVDKNVCIGDRVKVQNNVNIYDGVTVEDDVFLGPSMTFTNDLFPRSFNDEWNLAETTVKRGASVGANCTILCAVTIGEYALIGAGSTVTKDVPAHALMVGNPARQIGWVCECGYGLNPAGTCEKCERRYPEMIWPIKK